jgi:AcrR family transcriptional regulator
MISEQRGTRAERKAATRSALLDAARATIAEQGLDGATTRRIAERAGVAHGTFFVHFADAGELVEILLDEHLERVLDDVLASAAGAGGLVDQLVHVARELYLSYFAEADLARSYLTASLFRPTDGPLGARERRFRAWVVARFDDAAERGEVAAEGRSIVFETYFALYFGLLIGGLRGDLTLDDQVELLRAALLRLVGER